MRWNIAWATVLSCYPCWQFWQYARILRFFGRGVGFVDYTSIIKISWVIILPRMAGSVRALRIVFQAALMFLFCAWKHLPISPTCSMNSLSTGSCELAESEVADGGIGCTCGGAGGGEGLGRWNKTRLSPFDSLPALPEEHYESLSCLHIDSTNIWHTSIDKIVSRYTQSHDVKLVVMATVL